MDLSFLLICHNYNYIPQFMKFKLYRRSIHNTNWYQKTIKQLLIMEIKTKQSQIRKGEIFTHQPLNYIKSKVSTLDFIWISKIIHNNISRYKSNILLHEKKLKNLGLNHNLIIEPQ